jgi:hypothetical protein
MAVYGDCRSNPDIRARTLKVRLPLNICNLSADNRISGLTEA